MQIAAWIFTAAAVCCYVGTEIVRSVVDQRRVIRDGLGGTFDAYLWGTLAMLAFTAAAAVCFLISHPTR